MAVEIDAIQSAKSIGWTDALLTRLGANSVALGARLSITAPANSSALSSTGYSLTGSNAQSMIDLAGTWNTTGTPTLIKANVTNTASNAASLLMDLQVGGVGVFRANNLGVLFLNGGSTGSVARRSDVDMLMLHSANTTHGVIGIGAAGYNHGINITSTASLAWTNDTPAATRDVVLLRDAANTLALRNAVNAQALNVYNTYTSGSVYERGFMRWVSNVLEIGTEHVGASARGMRLVSSSGSIDVVDGSAVSQINFNIQSANGIRVASDRPIGFTSGAANGSSPDATFRRVAAGIIGVRAPAITDGGALSFIEMTSPSAPATNGVYIFAEDNGSGKTRLMARFATGATQQIAIEP